MSQAVVCPEPLAAKVGSDIFKKGGNAFDVMVATALAQGVVNPKLCSLAGNAGALTYHNKTGELKYFEMNVTSGSKAFPDVYEIEESGLDPWKYGFGIKVKDNANLYGYKSIVIPRLVRGLDVMHKRYGTMPWKELLQPAIKLARNGYKVYPYLVKMGFNEAGLPHLTANEECAKIFTKNGRPYKVGETLVLKDYAKSLERVAEEGADVFYHGELAERMAEDIQAHGGFVTLEDLHMEQPSIYDPLVSDYHGYKILGDKPPGRGTFIREVFNILEGINLKELGWNTPEYLNIIARTMLLGYDDRVKYMFDPKRVPGVMENTERITSKEYAKKMREKILAEKHEKVSSLLTIEEGLGDDTTYLGVYDDEGNAVSLIHTINSSSGIVTPGLGFMYNGHMHSFNPQPGRPDSVAPRANPRTGGMETMVLKAGKPYIIVGTPGGRASADVQAILNVIEFGMNPQLAVSAPRLNIYKTGTVCVESNFPSPYPVENLEEMLGMKCKVDDYTGRLGCIVIDPDTGIVEAGTDPRGGGGLALLP